MLVVATYARRVTSGELVGILESGVRAAESTLEDIWNKEVEAGFKVEMTLWHPKPILPNIRTNDDRLQI
jgi:hypothetical protein